MDFNKIISLIVGFVVLILLFIFIARQFRGAQTTTSSIVPTVTFTPSPTSASKGFNPLSWFSTSTTTPTPSGKPMVNTTPTTVTKISVYKTSPTLSTKADTSYKSKITPSRESGVIVDRPAPTYTTYQASPQKKVVVQPTEIPQTGAGTLVLLFASLGTGIGVYLRKLS